MLRSVSLVALLFSSVTPVWAQRADENAVRAAGDAFGSSVGNEKIGLYGASDVRGFSPITAGNIRIDGLSVTEHGGFTARIVGTSTIRVGLTAQGYPFPAPTGIADYALRTAGNEAVLSPILYLGPNHSVGLDVDAQLPIVRDRLGVAAGVTLRYDEPFPGEDAKSFQAGGVLRWRPAQGVELKPFYGYSKVSDDLTVGAIFTGGPYLPPKVERRYFGLDWTRSETRRQSYGAVGTAQITDAWQVRAGLFRWEDLQALNLTEQYRNVTPDGSARRQLVATANQTASSTSGEFRSSYAFSEGERLHTIHLAFRGRDTLRSYGGADVRDLGSAVVGERTNLPRPQLRFGSLSKDSISQLTGGVGYHGRWLGAAELSLGIQKTKYEKVTEIPSRPTLVTKDDPWLFNGTLAMQLSSRLVAYGGYSSGLEESGTAPSNATNRNSATPALRTSQRDAGIRYAFSPNLTLVAGVFDVRKPYFNLDQGLVFRELGTVRHRGIEVSFSGRPIDGLSMVAGAVLLDADVSGEAVDLGRVGSKPVGTAARTLKANLDYRLPSFQPISVDLAINSMSGQIASIQPFPELGGRQLRTEPQTTLDLGARYRFKIAGAPATLRAQMTNVFDLYTYKVFANSSFRFIDERRVLLSLAVDI